MVQRRIMLIGATGCGKTSLANVLDQYGEPVSQDGTSTGIVSARGRQDVRYGKHTIDVPGGYFENPWMYNHLIALAQNHASHVVFVVSQSQRSVAGAPGLAKVFGCSVTGVVTHCDVKSQNKNFCLKQLQQYGVPEPYFNVSVADGSGIPELLQHLF
ncbi:EutP/PduV family microcompartment system protein [Halodesulfovibrio marinisediminis]|uniref:Ethanolamine utilization protein EutP n=1 Tax=Halodesulfovibrio marinisediminis DSM 17456 TaxID=1121457 RepID=A0A1N6GY51_9BACT|nr:EutP/PduV family microcompartment system protein [Halodesulfovibrio marinisediminis]SIO12474.1 ethanolamine utilization protein EutP [Halodesulfovibrio marinisediminis DSM 17456]